MKWLERLIIVLGLGVLIGLLWKLDAAAVWKHASVIGWGMLLILTQQVVDHILNAWGWVFAFNPRDGAKLSFTRLIAVRVIGDGLNYLTPSATIAGELVRPALVHGELPWERKVASVVTARFTQSLGQALFIMLGLAYMVYTWPLHAGLPLMEFIRDWFFIPMGVLALTVAALLVYAFKTWKMKRPEDKPEAAAGSWGKIKSEILEYSMSHPGRFILSVIFFTAGYLWGAVEAYLLCLFMGIPPTVALAVSIEVLSSVIDGLLFMVPAKIGTQEAGKTAIFTGLGLPAAQGFAFGLIRHMREVTWAGLGLILYALIKRADPKLLTDQGRSSSVHA